MVRFSCICLLVLLSLSCRSTQSGPCEERSDAPDPGCDGPCPGNQLLCDDQCVDPNHDPYYCGVDPSCAGTELPACDPLTERCHQGRCEPADIEDPDHPKIGEAGSMEQLAEGWQLAAADDWPGGKKVSRPEFTAESALTARVPSTPLAAMVAAGQQPDPNFGMNLRSMPGGSDAPIAKNFSNLEMAADNPFRGGWWYRRPFEVPAGNDGRRVELVLEGVNYRGQLWINGKLVADEDQLVGTFRTWRFDITRWLADDGDNVLAILVKPPGPQELAHTFVDWMPLPGDKNMGLWRPVWLHYTGAAKILGSQVHSEISDDLGHARLSVDVEVENLDPAQERSFTVQVQLGAGLKLQQQVTLKPGVSQRVQLREDPRLVIPRPKLWWSHDLGDPALHTLAVQVLENEEVLDHHDQRFGIRSVSSELDDEGHRYFKLNHRRFLVRGAGYAPDLMFRYDRAREAQELALVRDLNLNVVRLEGKFGSDSLLDIADETGVLLMPGWCCCDHWERWDDWDEEDHLVARESQRSQVRRLRSRPSMLTWLNGSDKVAPEAVERDYLQILREAQFNVPYLSSATAAKSEVSGPSGVKMAGPYDYVPPGYWLDPKNDRGGARGFATEIGPGPSLPLRAGLERFIPEDELWPSDNEVWRYHAGGGVFDNLRIFDDALKERYGQPDGLDDYLMKAQLMGYEAQRAMFEGYRRRKQSGATGIIQWMLNDGWPSTIWHLYDYELMAGGSYYGAKSGNRSLHIQYADDHRDIVVAHAGRTQHTDLRADVSVYDFDLQPRYQRSHEIDVGDNDIVVVDRIPEIGDLDLRGHSFFLDLRLYSGSNSLVDHNFYWLSTREERLNWEASTWYHTPIEQFADHRQLAELDRNDGLRAQLQTQEKGEWAIELTNGGENLAFFVRLSLENEDHREVTPLYWTDNYVTLLPGETRKLKVRSRGVDLDGARLIATGSNVERHELALTGR